VPLPSLAAQAALMQEFGQKQTASKALALEAVEVRRAAWASFEAALFEPHLSSDRREW
jgi:type I restriction enzyme S subunit